ncbi:DUF5655 domain-containing protein [Nakamurella endophytica]|uniref:DUF5655 domain-containing protein n=1 Tax=Nakamurella endophytica TaxID=1748367 RepID=A0A917TBD7_9ACTN|nr:DUF5655 domain-containing protein [Nakamurella endophytica]GGM16092.1 hypothetical protein GCM10011594_40120 [Nakamurella endophytica]
MAGEMVFTVSGPVATAAQPIGLAEAGLRERQHLQEWVIAHPQVIGEDVKIVTAEFGRWTDASGGLERDRLDLLGLDSTGQLVVVELKRDRAPDTVDMQALKYAALVSRFTRDHLAQAHAQFLTARRGEPVDPDTALAELEQWASITDEGLQQPRLVLMASQFPKTVTATVVFLNQVGLDVRLLAFQAYRTTNDVLVTVSQHYPPPEVQDFVLSPELTQARQERGERQTKQRDVSAVTRLLEADLLEPGERLEFKPPSAVLQATVEPWIQAQPNRRYAIWQADPTKPLVWEADGQSYSPTGLTRHILGDAADRTSQVQGPAYWINSDGHTLVELARSVPAGQDVPAQLHLDKLNPTLRTVFDAVDAAITNLGTDVTRRSRIKGFKYYAQRKLVDLQIHNDHLSVYIRGLDAHAPGLPAIIVGGTHLYSHAQVRPLADLTSLKPLLKQAYRRASA